MANTPFPRPYETGWSFTTRSAAQAFWDWHDALAALEPVSKDVLHASYEDVKAGAPIRLVPDAVSEAAYEACDRHSLKRHYLAVQVRGVHDQQPPVRFDTAEALKQSLRRWIVPHGRLLAGLIRGADMNPRSVDRLSYGFFLTASLVQLPQHLESNRLYIPRADMERAEVSMRALKRGTCTEPVQKLLWKQAVRARDALARGREVVRHLSWRQSWRFKYWWLGALEVLSEIERRNFDVWSEPLSIGPLRTGRVHLQSLFGRATSRMS